MSNHDDTLRNLFSSDGTEDNANSRIPSNNGNASNKIVEEKGEEEDKPVTTSIDDGDIDNNEPITSKDIQFVLKTISKQAPYEKTQIKQIFYGICSSQTSTKIHHNINSKNSGDGKSYLLELVVDLFPDSFILKFNNISDKALYHQSGIESVKNGETGKYEDLSPLIIELESGIEEIESKIEEEENAKGQQQKYNDAIKSYRSQIKSIEGEINDLKSKAVKIIDLDDKAFIFLDTPNEGLFNNLMSILSQDSRDQLYIFTDKDSSGKRLQSRTVLLRGSPLIMTTQVVDDTRNYRFQEKNRRFIHVNPNTTENKIEEAMRQIGTKLSGPPDDFEDIVSSEDIKKSIGIVERICDKLKDHAHKCLNNDIKGNGVKIPYASIISSSLPPSDSWSMTVLTRLINYIAIITKVNMDSRPKVVDIETGVCYPISSYGDLKEALELMRTAALSIRPYQLDWYNNVFLSAFRDLGTEPNCKVNEYGTVIEKENIVGLTTKQLADRMNQQEAKVSNESIYESYLRPLTKQGVINQVRSVLNGKENLYYPVNQGTEKNALTTILHLTQDCRLIVNNPFNEKEVLEESFKALLERRSKGGGDIKYKIVDVDGSELSLCNLFEKYFFNTNYHTCCSVILPKPNTNILEDYSMTEKTKDKDGNENREPKPNNPANKDNNALTKSSKDITAISDSTVYEYTTKDVEEFFASDLGQQKEHNLEESICKPLIGQHNNKPFFLYCKIHTEVENIHLESIEDHIRLNDPELHKAKLLELFDNEMDKRQYF